MATIIDRRQFIRATAAGILAAAAPELLTGCGANGTSGSGGNGARGTVTVGSKSFTESEILAEVYALVLENAGFTVKRSMDIANSVVHTAIVNGDIDLYPGYTGTALISVLKLPTESDPKKVYKTVKRAYKKKFKLEWLDMTAANDGQGLAITTKAAKKYGIKTISDLQAHASEIRFTSGPEFDTREDCLPALQAAYGEFNWASHDVTDDSLKYSILSANKADVTSVATTEGQLADTKTYALLEDDKHVWPPYNVAPIVRADVLKKYPDIATVLNRLGKTLDTKTLTKLNAKVDVDKQDYEDVAEDYVDSLDD